LPPLFERHGEEEDYVYLGRFGSDDLYFCHLTGEPVVRWGYGPVCSSEALGDPSEVRNSLAEARARAVARGLMSRITPVPLCKGDGD
jgi:hypothetical protein